MLFVWLIWEQYLCNMFAMGMILSSICLLWDNNVFEWLLWKNTLSIQV